ncbi:hypothetical protein C7974DRAFT_122322 [Boeremia exigua]|uniref:uncharacterized protein n=1 Tax=Boeremia exigua TaxID=749465 RepID=UPI001E8DFB42|nr:uncharacterized protein C7974DRAFT_122322 [Boeremia exigua]KAH6638842.1 hypothetical protein C7974DRAFT_122322 [Boeremia exigua]
MATLRLRYLSSSILTIHAVLIPLHGGYKSLANPVQLDPPVLIVGGQRYSLHSTASALARCMYPKHTSTTCLNRGYTDPQLPPEARTNGVRRMRESSVNVCSSGN